MYSNAMSDRFAELPLAAQTAYAELAEATRTSELSGALANLTGSFHRRALSRGTAYWYFTYRDPGGERPRMIYVGPDNEAVRRLVDNFKSLRGSSKLAPQSRAAIAQGCTPLAATHFRIIKRLAEYGLFRAGGILIGTHAFIALGNLLGVRWLHGTATLDVDFAHAGRNVSVALPADLKIDVHGALESLKMGLLPISELDGTLGAQYRSRDDAQLRVDFVTSLTRGAAPVHMPDLNVALKPLKFMEFSLEGTTTGCVFANAGACTVNLPALERMAVHKLIVYGERPVRERTKATKDLLQAAAIFEWCLSQDRRAELVSTWEDALGRGRGWKQRATQGMAALLKIAPQLALN
jgi:hypothetical protein